MKTKSKVSNSFIYFFGAFGGILFGYDIGVMTGALPFLREDWGINSGFIIGLITSSVMLGAIFGGILAGRLSDKLGRRKMILISALIFVVGSILSGIAPHNGNYFLIISRVILGLASGAASSLNWLGSFLVGLLFPIMTAFFPQEIVFAIFGIICILGVVFVKKCVPESRGKTLEEIEKFSGPESKVKLQNVNVERS
ncbi:MFS transporter [Mammaliicoccus sciuri]|uniref:MFS transporter n=1 Tax=Mammaliicoccus sciuri TaxID=1296 RepID=UPI0034DD6171